MEDRKIKKKKKITEYKEIKNNKDIDLLENEILDSLAFIELIEMLNEEFNIELQPTQIKPDIWRSVKSIAEYIQQLLK